MVTVRETGCTSDKRADSIKFSLYLNFGKYITDEKLQVLGVALFYIGFKDKHHSPPPHNIYPRKCMATAPETFKTRVSFICLFTETVIMSLDLCYML